MIEYIAKAGNNVICHCEIHKKNDDSNTWVIPAWFTEEGYKNHGIGTAVLASALRDMKATFGIPNHIEYIDWESHIYELNCNKVLRFAGVL